MTVLNGNVQSPTCTVLGFDTDTVVLPATATQFFDNGYRFCVRYLSRGAESSADLTYQEACDILDAGLALMPVQHVAQSGWSPTAGLGTQYGSEAVSNAQDVGFPAGVNLWCDLEGCHACASDVIAYCNAWYAAVSSAGYVPGLYVGANAVLSGLKVYEDLSFQHYWKSKSKVPVAPPRGYQMQQTAVDVNVFGILIDQDSTQADSNHRQVLWLAPNA